MSRLAELINIAASQVGYGQLQVNLEIHNNQVKSLQGSEHMEKHYPGDGYQQAIDLLNSIMASERTQGKTGLITFTFDNRNGQTKKLFVHRQFKHSLTDSQ